MSAATVPPPQVEPERDQSEHELTPKLKGPGKDTERRIFSILKTWLVLPLLTALVSAVVIGRGVKLFLGARAYKVLLIRQSFDPETAGVSPGFSRGCPKLHWGFGGTKQHDTM